MLTLVPILLAADFGGVLHWTHYPLALAVIATAGIATVSIMQPGTAIRGRRYLILIVLGMWACYGWTQTIAFSPSIVQYLNPASADAYTNWVAPFAPLTQFPVSIAVDSTVHIACLLTLLVAVLWTGLSVLETRNRISGLLAVASIGAAVCASYGLFLIIHPKLEPPGVLGFSTFVNRNNAALFLNLGFAASLGLLSWRLNAMTGQAVDDQNFQVSDLFSLVNDRESITGIFCSVACIAGLLACGSRSGIASALVGGLFAFGWVRQRRGFMALPIVGGVIGVCVLLLVVPGFETKSLERFDLVSNQDKASLFSNNRILHWQDGWRTGIENLPSGSGLGTYAYAYLPHQESSPQDWFHHADNLWLELFVEQGIPGLIFVLALLIIIIRSLRVLGESADPIDQGLRATGWFAIGVVVFSQAWDFGLIIPANLFLFTTIIAAVIARSQTVPLASPDAPKQSLFPSWKQRMVSFVCGGAVIAGAAVCIKPLQRDAEIESLVRSIEHEYDVIAKSKSQLDEKLDLLKPYVDSGSTTATMLSAKLQHERGRIAEVYEADPPTTELAIDVYRNTGRLIRRLQWQDRALPSQNLADQNESMQRYRLASQYSAQVLPRLPYSLQARASLIYLDFVDRDRQKSRTALQQLAQLQTRAPNQLVRLAVLASEGGEDDIAKEKWQEALVQAPEKTIDAIEFLKTQNGLTVSDIVPNLPANQRVAARYMLENAEIEAALKGQSKTFLTAALDRIACAKCETNREKSECEELTGDILFSLNRSEDSFPHYVTAIKSHPTNPQLRSKYIDRLRMTGKRDEARRAASRARSAIPNQPRFQRIIDEMAEQDLREGEQFRKTNPIPAAETLE